MAFSGLVLFLFVVVHMIGNLQIFLGPDTINEYGHFLQTKQELVWMTRIGLLLMLILHLWAAIKLSAENRAARPQRYGEYKSPGSSYASRTMLLSGLLIFTFVIYHLLHFTVQTEGINFANTDFRTLQDAKERHDIYNMMVIGFQQPIVSIFYIISMALLSLHLSHGVASMFQSFGWKNRKYSLFIDRFALVAAAVLIVGYSSIPIAVLTGFLERVAYGA